MEAALDVMDGEKQKAKLEVNLLALPGCTTRSPSSYWLNQHEPWQQATYSTALIIGLMPQFAK